MAVPTGGDPGSSWARDHSLLVQASKNLEHRVSGVAVQEAGFGVSRGDTDQKVSTSPPSEKTGNSFWSARNERRRRGIDCGNARGARMEMWEAAR